MAIDTRNKRASILGVGLAAALALPAPDGAVVEADRQHVGFAYAAATGGAVVVEPTPHAFAGGVLRTRIYAGGMTAAHYAGGEVRTRVESGGEVRGTQYSGGMH